MSDQGSSVAERHTVQFVTRFVDGLQSQKCELWRPRMRPHLYLDISRIRSCALARCADHVELRLLGGVATSRVALYTVFTSWSRTSTEAPPRLSKLEEFGVGSITIHSSSLLPCILCRFLNATIQSVTKCDADVSKNFFVNIALTGGVTISFQARYVQGFYY